MTPVNLAIQSNIQGVIRQVTRLKTLVPAAALQSISPEKWGPVARSRAQLTLDAIARNDLERSLIPRFVETVVAVVSGPGMLLLRIEQPPLDELAGNVLVERVMMAEEDLQKPGPKRQIALSMDDEKLAKLLQEAILDFVTEEKDLSEEEEGWMDDDPVGARQRIANNLRYILFTRALPDEAKSGLAAAVQDYISRRWWPAYLGSDTPDVGHWLVAVLLAWREMFLSQWPLLIEQQLRAAWRKAQTELI